MKNCSVQCLVTQVVSISLLPHGLQPVSLPCPGKNTGVDCHVLLQGIFPSQGSRDQIPPLMSLALAGSFLITSTAWEAYIYAVYIYIDR